MNKVIIIMIAVIISISAIFTAYALFNPDEKQEVVEEEQAQVEEEILDECTEEYEAMQTEVTNSDKNQERTSPNCVLTTKTYFNTCKHIISEYSNLPENEVNMTEKQIQEKYPDYIITTFSNNEVVLYQEKEGECGEHYLVKDNNGIVTIYNILENGELEVKEETSISTEYLPETDKSNMKNGIKVNGKQELNRLLEDFE